MEVLGIFQVISGPVYRAPCLKSVAMFIAPVDAVIDPGNGAAPITYTVDGDRKVIK